VRGGDASGDPGVPDPDGPLVAQLRAFVARADPVPALVVATAKAALGWRRLDADLAELLSDSALEAGSPVLVRGAGDDVRSLSFAAGELAIEVEVSADGPGRPARRILGQLTPPGPASVAAQFDPAAGDSAAVDADRLGRFRLALPHAGRVRLRIERPSGAVVETSWFTA
jgi:hypothetical protein